MRDPKDIAKECAATYEHRKSTRSSWDTQWQQIADYFCPRKAQITGGTHTPDSSKEAAIYDGRGFYAVDVAVRGQMSDIIPADRAWFSFDPPDKFAGSFRIEQWCQKVTRIARGYLERSGFYAQGAEFLADRTAFGTGCSYCEETGNPRNPVVFRHHRIGTYTIAENADGVVDCLDFERQFTARQLVEKFGKEIVSDKVREAYDAGGGKQDSQFPVLHCVYPRSEAERILGKHDPVNMPIASVWLEKDSKQPLRISGFREMPFCVSRWSTWEGYNCSGPYGYSPAFQALPDMRQLNKLQKNLDVLAEKKANPPLLVPIGLKGDIDFRAGGVTWFDPTTQDRVPRVWGAEGDYQLGVQRADQKRAQIDAFFQVDLWLAISRMDRPNVTAEEIRARIGEQSRQFQGTYTLLTTEWLSVQLNRFLRILMRAGLLPPPPREMIEDDGAGNLSIEEPKLNFSSRIALALKEEDNSATTSVLSFAAELAKVSPEVLDVFNADAMLRGVARNRGLPSEFTHDPEFVDQLRASRAQQQQQAQQAAMAEQMSKAAKNVGSIPADSPVAKQFSQMAA